MYLAVARGGWRQSLAESGLLAGYLIIEMATSSDTFDYVTHCPFEKNADVVNGTNI